MKKYRFLSLLLAGLLALSLTAPALALEDPAPRAKAVIVVDGDHGEILYDLNARERMYPASITKIMTSLVVLDAVDAGEISLDTPVTASAQAVDLPWDSSTAEIKAGETMPILSLLYCDLLPSGNDACNILAEAVAGTSAEFVARMNAKAQQLGMEDTHFANPHGLHDPEHYTTAYDIYLMASAAMENETFRTIVRSPSYTLPATNLQPERTIYSSNGLLSSFYSIGYTYGKAIGIKTGYTGEAGRCLASAAVDELGRTFYCVVLGTEDSEDENGVKRRWSFVESKRLLEWAFHNFHRISLLDQETENVLREVSVTLSDEADYVQAQPVGRIEATMPSDYDPKRAELLFDLPESIEAPVAAGDKLGTITIKYDGVEYGTLDMVAMDNVARSDFLYTVQQIKFYWGKWWVKTAVAAGAVLAAALAVFVTVVLPRRKARRRYSRAGGGRRPTSNYRGRR
ncbi:MAG: D-alanyl-D-alanine carboxypeptidase [Oscillospiraceae bacterium]|nr:D-alanyl-D-alanine carboxypeptidase [Oscillospiraceae bacterium]MCI9549692.1 D-alanyl-D-alanine carboxypeptidase [Oscillospiraceae bacterium]